MFSQKFARAISRIKKKNVDYIAVNSRGGKSKIPVHEICFIEAQGHNLLCYMENRTVHTFRGKLQELEENLKDYGFFRCHKGYLVNFRYVDAIKENCCVIGEYTPLISRTKRREFMDELTKYMSGVTG